MWPFNKKKEPAYHPVAGDEEELKDLGKNNQPSEFLPPVIKPQGTRYLLPIFIAVLALLSVAVFAFGSLRAGVLKSIDAASTSSGNTSTSDPASAGCRSRREWRTLSSAERKEYISAVLCLRSQPSILQPSNHNWTSYDDFPWIHSHVGYRTHNSAPFLPWHRYFLHIYESTLRSKCGYTDGLVYWGWTLDSEKLEESPVFDPETGFGGDGEVGGEITVGRSGRCIVDGPFAGTHVDYFDVNFQPHCLSRGFRDLDGKLGHMDGHDISPASIEEVLSLDNYEAFVALMESRVHDAIPFGIGGDFETFTAPYGKVPKLQRSQQSS